MFKRGYENGEQTIEIYEGRVDLVLYSERTPSFYFYRFDSESVFGEPLGKDVHYIYRHDVEKYLKDRGMDYNELVVKLLNVAWANNMTMRDEM